MTVEIPRKPGAQREGSAHHPGHSSPGKPPGQMLTGGFAEPTPSDDVDALQRLQRHVADLGHREAKLVAALANKDLRAAQSIGESIGVLRICLDLLLGAARQCCVEEGEVQRLGSDGGSALDRMSGLAKPLIRPGSDQASPVAPGKRIEDWDPNSSRFAEAAGLEPGISDDEPAPLPRRRVLMPEWAKWADASWPSRVRDGDRRACERGPRWAAAPPRFDSSVVRQA